MSSRKEDCKGLVCSASPRGGSSTTKNNNKKHAIPRIGVTRTPHNQVFVHSEKAELVANPSPLKL